LFQLDQAPLQKIGLASIFRGEAKIWGILIALGIIGIWASSLFLLISLDISKFHILALLPAMLWQTFLYTGLFITAHDAMHGAVSPQNHKINKFLGELAVFLYALFSYKKLLKKHWLHHHSPASEQDPDFHNGKHQDFFAWYFHFMKGYWNWFQIIGLIIIFNIANCILHLPSRNLTLFWIIPSLLSSVQLFYFGTFLPHQQPKGGYSNPHRAQTIPRPVFWSFIACYHFGYHEEHHEYPHVPWWKLPTLYRKGVGENNRQPIGRATRNILK